MTSIKKSNQTVQIFRAFAIIAVVMIHTTPSGIEQVIFRPFINFSVATFLFLSGYLTTITNSNWNDFYKRRITRVIIPYIIWSVIYTLASKNIKLLPINLLTAKSAAPLYYILVYIQFILLTPILGKLAKSKYQALGWFIAPISVTLNYIISSGNGSSSYFSIFGQTFCFGWFTFYYLGLILGNNCIEIHYSIKKLFIFYLLSIILQIAEGYILFRIGDANCGTQLKLSSLLSSSLFLLILYMILRNSHITSSFQNQFKYLKIVGDYSFGIYLSHYMLIKILKSYTAIKQFIPYPVSSIIVVLFSFVFCYLGSKVIGEKLCKWMGLK